jgi:pimeloyl-ACP methyl ester carboxylesterase
MPIAKLDEMELYYEEHGQGEPVLLVPPSWWPCDPWKITVLPMLSKRYRTIIFDPRGTGRSSRPDHGFTASQLACDSIALLDHLGISTCHVAGFAQGGEVAQAMAIEHPEHVSTLTMAAAGPGHTSGPAGLQEATKKIDQEIRATGFKRFIRGHVDNDTMAFSSIFFREHPEVVQALAQALWERQGTAEYFRYHVAARHTWDTLANASRLKLPTLVIVGSEDNVRRGNSTPVVTARRLLELVPGAEPAVVPGVKHMVFWDGTGAVSMLLDFLARHPIARL